MPYRTNSIKVKRNSDRKKYYKPIRYPSIPLSVNDLYVITSDRDRLDLLANQFYNDVDLWWIIANANTNIRRDSYALKPGIEIRIPGNHNLVVRTFERINTRKDQL